MTGEQTFKVAAVQAAPIFLDLKASVDKAIALIDQAGKEGARLIGFPETWLPGYPWWIWLGPPVWGLQFMQRYHENGLVRDSAEMRALAAAAKRNDIVVVLGHAEKARGSLYMAQSIIDADGAILMHRRKLKPSRAERTIFGEGDGSGLNVMDTAIGRVGAMCCWEHIQPLSKYAMFTLNPLIHVAAWPALSLFRKNAYAPGPDMTRAINQVYALEGQCFVVAATTVMDKGTLDLVADTPERHAMLMPEKLKKAGGASMIYGPDGQPLQPFMDEGKEGLVVAEIDLDAILMAKLSADPAGHSARPDVLRLMVNRRAAPPVVAFDTAFEEVTDTPRQDG